MTTIQRAIEAAACLIRQHYYIGGNAEVAEDRIAHIIRQGVLPVVESALDSAREAQFKAEGSRSADTILLIEQRTRASIAEAKLAEARGLLQRSLTCMQRWGSLEHGEYAELSGELMKFLSPSTQTTDKP